jgi:hypothetical protein
MLPVAGRGFVFRGAAGVGASGPADLAPSSRDWIREIQSPEGSGRGGSGGSIEVFGRLRIMSPRRSAIHSVSPASGVGGGGGAVTGFSRAPQSTQVTAPAGFFFPHIGQRWSAMGYAVPTRCKFRGCRLPVIGPIDSHQYSQAGRRRAQGHPQNDSSSTAARQDH